MGDIKKLKKKYSTPRHPWNKKAIEEEALLTKEYGLQKKQEIHIAASFLKKYKDIAKRLIADHSAQGAKEKEQMITKLQKLSLLQGEPKLDDVLSLTLRDVLNRRVQSLVAKKGFARSMKQARQFITHNHVLLGSKPVTSPSTLLTMEAESNLTFKPSSSLAAEDHPERVPVQYNPAKEAKAAKRKAALQEKSQFKRGRRKGERK